MSGDRQSVFPDGKPRPVNGRGGCADWPIMLMPAAVVAFGKAESPANCLMWLQAATASAVQIAAEIGRIKGLLRSHSVDLRRPLLQAPHRRIPIPTRR